MIVGRTCVASGRDGDAIVRVGDVPIRATTREIAVREVMRACERAKAPDRRSGLAVRFVNAYSVSLAYKSSAYKAVLQGSGVNFPDGAPLALVARWLSGETCEQVRGPQFLEDFLAASSGTGIRHFFFGTTPSTLSKLAAKLEQKYPDVASVGFLAPEFGSVSELLSERNLDKMRESAPDVIWIGLGTPKQDFVAIEVANRLEVPVLGVGAAFDFTAGTLPVAPRTFQRVGLEWMYRLLCEPRRLWRRYLFGNARFIKLVFDDVCGALGRRR